VKSRNPKVVRALCESPTILRGLRNDAGKTPSELAYAMENEAVIAALAFVRRYSKEGVAD
jgi:hypothetical protein